ncbi:GNAT family N-acetyltransferase [Aestuariibaculum sp. M13]|uniref:GNAT family N-acetyltransferase n=1 Tax=Aestuariibaculum sp. M13 TaxID=2967132 RepID=UPI002159D10E|nr:GNAT family N-acetyltransferase [Aestuariibaculum sp. M13]MCR8667254.1 GNAT family N-acetyltransferase [Aestuariibaculum sp. M13]
MLQIRVKAFDELTVHELYNILQLRSEVFVVEQNCVYQDVDAKDEKALHILGFKHDKIVAYARIFKPGDYFEFSSIGRVVVHLNERDFKYGYDIMKAAIEAIKTHFNESTIRLSAQLYLKNFYNNLGFVEVGESYLEDDIPHIAMVRE